MAYQNQSSAYMTVVHRRSTNNMDLNQSEGWRLFWIMLTQFFESILCVPKTWFCPFLFDLIQ